MSIFAKSEQLELEHRRCRYCGGEGFLGCDATIPIEQIPDPQENQKDWLGKTATLIVRAWRNAVACDCNAGVEFAKNQAAWRELEAARCKRCNSTGLLGKGLDGRFCSCQMGRDLDAATQGANFKRRKFRGSRSTGAS